MGLYNLRFSLIISFFFGIIFYHVLTYFNLFDDFNVRMIYGFSAAFITIVLFLTVTYSRFLLRIFFPSKHIDGTFNGTIIARNNPAINSNMRITFKQNLIRTALIGTYFPNGIEESFNGYSIREGINEALDSYLFIIIKHNNNKCLLIFNVVTLYDLKIKMLTGDFTDLTTNTTYVFNLQRPLVNIFGCPI